MTESALSSDRMHQPGQVQHVLTCAAIVCMLLWLGCTHSVMSSLIFLMSAPKHSPTCEHNRQHACYSPFPHPEVFNWCRPLCDTVWGNARGCLCRVRKHWPAMSHRINRPARASTYKRCGSGGAASFLLCGHQPYTGPYAAGATNCNGVRQPTFSPLKYPTNVGMARTPHSEATSCTAKDHGETPFARLVYNLGTRAACRVRLPTLPWTTDVPPPVTQRAERACVCRLLLVRPLVARCYADLAVPYVRVLAQ